MRHAPDVRRVLRNGRIRTFWPAQPEARTLVIERGRIVALGDDTLAERAGRDAEVIDLGGAFVIPGINDTHAHMEREGLKLLRPSLAGARAVADILERVRAAARPAGEWVVTMPVGTPPFFFDGPASLAEGRVPDRHELESEPRLQRREAGR